MFSKVQKNQNNLTLEEKEKLDAQSRLATMRYSAIWCEADGGYRTSAVFNKARASKSARYGNELLDCAMAICGDPWYAMTKRHYCKEAEEFLALFRDARFEVVVSSNLSKCSVDLWRNGLLIGEVFSGPYSECRNFKGE